MAEDNNEIPDLDDLFSDEMDFSSSPMGSEGNKYLFIGRKALFDDLQEIIKRDPLVEMTHVKSIDDAIDHLLVDIFAIVMLDNQDPDMDIITTSRIVRVNHPLARIVALSASRRSLFIADIINHGAVDAYLPLPIDEHELLSVTTEQQAKHDIDRMLTNFASDPPELSAASYLLLDPSLSASEDEPEKFVGIMIAYKSVPRYSQYFEDLLAKDEILFAGYLSGITMLGQELLQSEDPLKEINFGGISVIFRFHGELQFSIFVRNLTKHNVRHAEKVISTVIERFLSETHDDLAGTHRPSNDGLENMEAICKEFEDANKAVKYRHEMSEAEEATFKGELVLLYGTDLDEQEKVENYLSSKVEYDFVTTTSEKEAKSLISKREVSVLLVDSDIDNVAGVQSPIDFAYFVKDEYPFTQVIYLMRDRRASSPIIRSLNSGAINYLISYRVTRKELMEWITAALEKAKSIKEQSTEMEAGGLNSALIAKTMIRSNEEHYLIDNIAELGGIFISDEEKPLFKRFWDTGIDQLDLDMLAGLVASLESVSGEMFYDESNVGGLELGDSNIVVEHREDLNIVFFVKNIGSHNANMIKRLIEDYTNKLWNVLEGLEPPLGDKTLARLDTVSNNILSDFSEQF